MGKAKKKLRSLDWFSDTQRPDQTALYLERFLNFGLTLDELRSGRPIIGIAQTGSDLVPCNRHHLRLAGRARDGVRDSGGGTGSEGRRAGGSVRVGGAGPR